VAQTRIDVIDAALMRIGCNPLMSESRPEAAQHLAIFESVTGYCLSVNPWHWNVVIRRLVRRSEPPERYWDYQYERPHDMLGAPRAYYNASDRRSPFTDVELLDGTIQTNASSLWLEMDKRSTPDTWPAYFGEVIQQALMGEFAFSVREDGVMRDRILAHVFGTPSEGRRGGIMGQCMDLDAQGKPQPSLESLRNPLIDARFEA
jgi:hypothetical protein